MAITLESLQNGGEAKPPRIIMYGVSGVGKTTFAANAPSPIMIQTEDGMGKLDITSWPLMKSYDEVMEALTVLATQPHEFKTLILDSLDWLEPLIWKKTCVVKNWSSLEDPGYGKGYLAVLDYWREYLEAINYLRDYKGMMIVQTAHSDIKRFDSPETESYDRYNIKLQKLAEPLVREHSDIVLFANYKAHVTEEKQSFNKERKRALGSGQRVVYTQERPAYVCKNRYGLPHEILTNDPNWNDVWSVLTASVPWLAQFAHPTQSTPA